MRQQLTASQIKAHLAAGKTSTGQVVNITVAGIQKSLKNMRLKPAKRSIGYLSIRQKATELDREGQSLEAIANEQAWQAGRENRGRISWSITCCAITDRNRSHWKTFIAMMRLQKPRDEDSIISKWPMSLIQRISVEGVDCAGQQRVWPNGGASGAYAK